MASLRQQLDALIEELSPAMEKAFREASLLAYSG